jgi:probable rRNA maturation factor
MKVLIKESPRSLGAARRTVKRIVEDLLASLKLQDRDLSILFTDNKGIRKYNRRFFQKDYPTNVISFSYMGGLAPEVMGDIVISVEKAREEAEASSIPAYERLFALIVHGLVHILGFDHVNDKKEARKMRYQEKKLLASVASHPLYQQLIKELC